MSNTSGVLVSTRATTPATTADPQSAMSAQFRMAEAIARAGRDMLPPAYVDKPGAVILVQQWAQAHDVDILTAMQTVAFVKGRPVIDATMQRALAERAGYKIRIVEASREAASVEVWEGETKIGTATYTMADARLAELANKDNWKKNPEDMLVARATTRAIKRHAPSVMLGFIEAEDAEQDPVAALAPPTSPVAEVSGAAEGTTSDDAPSATAPTDIVDAEVVTDAEPPAADEDPATLDLGGALTVTELRSRMKAAGMTQGDLIRQAQALDPAYGSLQLICDATDAHRDLILQAIDAAAAAKATAEEPF